MNRTYDTFKPNDGHRHGFGHQTPPHDVIQLEEAGAKVVKNDRPKRLEPAFPTAPLSRHARDQVANLVDRVFLFPNSSRRRVVAFSNVDIGNGSSEMCLHAGKALAERISGQVCLIDLKGKGSQLCRLFAVDGLPGLSDAMDAADGARDFPVQLADSNLWLLPPGSAGGNSCQFSSDRLHATLMDLRKQFDYILIDAPPATAASTILLGQMADGVVIVIEAHSTRRETARLAKQTLEAAHITLLGAVLNNRTFPIPEMLYRKL
jgi:Mrp family chromosome partitioning ATPase